MNEDVNQVDCLQESSRTSMFECTRKIILNSIWQFLVLNEDSKFNDAQQRQLSWNFQFAVTMTKLVGGCHAVGTSSDALPIILFLSVFIKVLLGIHVGNRYLIFDLTNFCAYLISQIFGNWISRVLIFVIICKKKIEIKRTKFCNFVFVFILSTGDLSQLNKTYIFQSN